MITKPIPTRPVSDNENQLRQKFYESIASQSELMDKVSQSLLTLELAIPGVYATMVKLMGGEKAAIIVSPAFYITFICWLSALILTFVALTPKKWVVDPDLLKQDPEKMSEGLGIEDFFVKTAQYKRRLVIASGILFFAGIFSAVFTIG